MKELEVLVKIEEPEKTVFEKVEVLGIEKIRDTYFNFPKITLRIRNSNRGLTLTYKKDIFRKKKWIYSKEYETSVNIYIYSILTLLKYKPTVIVEQTKYHCQNGIEIQKVKRLGLFLEVEGKNRKKIWQRIKKTGIKVSKECKVGKPQMVLNKKGR